MSFKRRPHLPMMGPEDVIPHLGSPSHWRECYSAKAIAEAWFGGLPIMVEHTLQHRCSTDAFLKLELVDVFLERKIELGDGRQPSQADALAILGLPDGLAIMAVEGKVREPFGDQVSGWIAGSPSKSGKHGRLARLRETLGLESKDVARLRYQLLHRTASAIYEAKRYRAGVAVMMVHSFDPHDTGIADFQAFASAMGFEGAQATRTVGPVRCEGVDLYLSWTADRFGSEGFSIVEGRKSDAGFFDDID